MKVLTFFISLATIIGMVILAQSLDKKKQDTEYRFDILTDSTILITDDGDDWETIDMDSLQNYLIDNNQ